MANKKITTKTVTTTIEEIIDTPLNEKTHIICILDSSGSMSSIMSDSIGSFNDFLKKQKELPDEATITVALFDSHDNYKLVYDYVDIKKAEELTIKDWYPRGMTSLYDGIGLTVNKDKAKINSMSESEKPDKVLVCIVTDGGENDSKEYTGEMVKLLIKDCEKDKWSFMYLAANQDAFSVGTSFGISAGNTFTYSATSAGVCGMSNMMNTATMSFRSRNSSSIDFAETSKTLLVNDGENGTNINS